MKKILASQKEILVWDSGFNQPVSFDGNREGTGLLVIFSGNENSSKVVGVSCLGEPPHDKKTIQTLTAIENALSQPTNEIKCIGPKEVFAFWKKYLDSKNINREIKFLDTQGKRFQVQVLCDGSSRMRVAVEKKIRVLVVDDSKTIRDLLFKIISNSADLECVGLAEKPSQVEGMIQNLKPDVLTLDINMPEMDGVTLLTKILPKYPIPTVMISAVSMEEGEQVLNALRWGAVDYIQKPKLNEIAHVAPLIVEKLKVAAGVKVVYRDPSTFATENKTTKLNAVSGVTFKTESFIAIGSSTGGTEAIRTLFEGFPDQIPPVLVTQHIPAVFSLAFAKRLNEIFKFKVKEAEDGDLIVSNTVLVAPGGKQMKVERSPKQPGAFIVRVNDDAPVNRHKPSVDYLFDSVAEHLGARALGIILTGMGSDGAKGLKRMRDSGAHTIAQAEEGCIVFGMPREAIELGAAVDVIPLPKISGAVLRILSAKSKAA